MGEMMVFYGLVEIVFVGGSLVKYGGYNLLELIVFEFFVIFGVYIYNLLEIFVKLCFVYGVIEIESLVVVLV